MLKEECPASTGCAWCMYQNPEISDCPNKGLPTARVPEWRINEEDQGDAFPNLEEIPNEELPGMWDRSDFTGGPEDAEPDLEVEPDTEEQMEDPTQGFHELTEQCEAARVSVEDLAKAEAEWQTTAEAVRELGRAVTLVFQAIFISIKFALVPVATWLDKVMMGSKERYAQWDQHWPHKL